MNVRALVAAAVVSFAVLAAGFVVGLMPTSVEGVSCGSAFSPDEESGWQADLGSTLVGGTGSGTVMDQCASRVETMRIPAVAILAVGGIGLVATAIGALVAPDRSQSSPTKTG